MRNRWVLAETTQSAPGKIGGTILYPAPFLVQIRAVATARRKKIDLRKTLFLLPNMITLASIFCGFDSIRTTATATKSEDFYRAALLLVYALFFDMLDGRVARLTKTQSAFGLQIDSLADVVSFGVAPALLVHQLSLHQRGMLGLFISFVFAGAGAVRLARFNVLSMGESGAPTKPGKYIIGVGARYLVCSGQDIGLKADGIAILQIGVNDKGRHRVCRGNRIF